MWVFLGVFSGVVVALTIVLCLFINDKNFIRMMILLSLLAVLCAWSWIYLLTSFLLPFRARTRLFQAFKNAKEGVFAGEIVSSNKKRTVLSFLEVTLIEVRKEGEIHSFYFDSFLGTCPLRDGMKVTLRTKTNFVIGYEVNPNEEASK